LIPQEAAQAIMNGLANFEPDLGKITISTAKDGVLIPELVRQLRTHIGEPHKAHVHFGATSQDIIDTSLVLRIKSLLDILESRIKAVDSGLESLEKTFGTNKLIGRTRMQAALPIRVSDRIADWRAPLQMALQRLFEIKPRLLVLQFGGAVGTLEKFGDKGREVAANLAIDLKLGLPQKSWHSDRSNIAEFASWLSLVTGALGKIGQDVALLAQNEISEIKLSGAGGSSAMPHKQNPVKAEVLVTLARFNATLLAGIHQSLVHEQERSGAAWTLEWMLLPQMCVATGSATQNAIRMLGEVEWIGGKH
jgi:3-carboxy-cis,cis-muconate cycloisomerase